MTTRFDETDWFRAVRFHNADKTSRLTAWPGIKDFQPGSVWVLEYTHRRSRSDKWAAPMRERFEGSYAALAAYAVDRGLEWIEAVP